MNGIQPLSDTLFSQGRQAVLGLLYGHPDESFYLRQIVSLSGSSVGQVQREVRQLAYAGIIRRFTQGRHVYFQADPSCSVFDELRGIVTKTLGAAAIVSEALAALRDRVTTAFIFGSVVRGGEDRDSDLDLMIIGEVGFAEVVAALRNAERRLGRPINAMVYPVGEFRDKLAAGHHFLRSVVDREKIFVIGDAHELGALSA